MSNSAAPLPVRSPMNLPERVGGGGSGRRSRELRTQWRKRSRSAEIYGGVWADSIRKSFVRASDQSQDCRRPRPDHSADPSHPRRRGHRMRRREILAGSWGVVAILAWSSRSKAQPRSSIRRLGVLTAFDAVDPEGLARLSVFKRRLLELGWIEGRDLTSIIDGARTMLNGDAHTHRSSSLSTLTFFSRPAAQLQHSCCV